MYYTIVYNICLYVTPIDCTSVCDLPNEFLWHYCTLIKQNCCIFFSYAISVIKVRKKKNSYNTKTNYWISFFDGNFFFAFLLFFTNKYKNQSIL